jgi:hypothetical protein
MCGQRNEAVAGIRGGEATTLTLNSDYTDS